MASRIFCIVILLIMAMGCISKTETIKGEIVKIDTNIIKTTIVDVGVYVTLTFKDSRVITLRNPSNFIIPLSQPGTSVEYRADFIVGVY